MKTTALLLSLFALAPLVAARAEDPATNAPAADPAAIVGAKAVIAAALRPEPKPAAETNSWDRFLLAVRALEDRQAETRGAVDPAAWLAAVDLALAVEPDARRTIDDKAAPSNGDALSPTVRGELRALLSVLPGPSGWDAIRAGLRERAERLAAETAAGTAAATDAPAEPTEMAAVRHRTVLKTKPVPEGFNFLPASGSTAKVEVRPEDKNQDGKEKKTDGRPVLLAALRVAADFLGGGGRGAPESLGALAALPLPEGLASNRAEKAVAALRRAMDDPGVPRRAPFSVERLMRKIEDARRGRARVRLTKELADLSDEDFAAVAARLFAPVDEDAGDTDEFDWYVDAYETPSNVVARLAKAAAALPDAGESPLAWRLVNRAEDVPEVRALFDAAVAAKDPLGSIRKRVADAKARRAASGDGEDEEDEDDEGGEDEDDVFPFSWSDRGGPAGQYAGALCTLLSADLNAGRLAEAEALAAPLAADDWRVVLRLAEESYYSCGLAVVRPNDAWRAFLEARLPAGEDLLSSPFLGRYAEACVPDGAERFEKTCVRLLGDAASGEKAKKALKRHRLDFARLSGDLDALEADFLEKTDPASKDDFQDKGNWCRALEALGETNRLARALDRVVALAATPLPDGSRRTAPVWAVPILARAGRLADAETVARAAMAEDAAKKRKGEIVWRSSSGVGDPAAELLRAYADAGRPDEALALAAGWPYWEKGALAASDARYAKREFLAATVARALLAAGGETNAAAAAALARAAAGDGTSRDWPYEILLETTDPAAFRATLDGFVRLDPYEERPWQWKAESLRREGDLAGAEAAARRALEIDPTDGEAPAGDRIRSYSILASVLEDRGGEADLSEAATLRRVVAAVRAAEKGDELTDLGYLAGAIARYDEAAGLFSDAYCVQWRLAERLRKAGRADEAAAHYEETFRHMPAQFGQVASLCFGCEGVFSSDESSGAAERILPALAAAPGAGASVHYLLGMLREHQKKYDEAWAAWSRALEIDPGHFDALTQLLDLRSRVERPAAEWAALQIRARRLDPFLRNHGEEPAQIVDWPGLWRAWDEAAAGAPAPWKAPEEPLFRFEAAARVDDAAKAARRAAEDEIAREAGAEAREDGEEDERGASGRDSGGAGVLPARMLASGSGRYWASRLVDLASALAPAKAYDDGPWSSSWSSSLGLLGGDYSPTHYSFADYDGGFGGFGDDDEDYFWDE